MRNAPKVLLLFHTLRYLRLKQVFFQVYYRIKRLRLRGVSTPTTRAWVSMWQAPKVMAPEMVGPVEFTFLGEKGGLFSPEDWNASQKSKLWIYNLHYFNDLNAVDAEARATWHAGLIDKWISENPPLNGNGWEPYVLSLRIVNWIKWFSRRDEVKRAWLSSLALQIKALELQLEYHILGNHLFANAKALVFAGCYFEGALAEHWLDKGLKILDREIKEQFLADGGHFELSPMYHAILLWDMCDLVNLAKTSNIASLASRLKVWQGVIVRGLSWLDAMTHPDGEVSFFNDSVFGVAPRLSDIRVYTEQLGCSPLSKVGECGPIQTRFLESSGYVAIEFGHASKAIMDTASLGPDYQPGHGHADTLSLELSLFGRRVLVNSGVSTYDAVRERYRQRGTQAHNTVCVDRQNSSEVWSSFRVARRARVLALEVDLNSDSAKIIASHDGYRRLPGRPLHRRELLLKEGSMIVEEIIEGNGEHEIEIIWHLHPQVACVNAAKAASAVVLEIPGETANQFARLSIQGVSAFRVEEDTWHPEFGKSVRNLKIIGKVKRSLPAFLATTVTWT